MVSSTGFESELSASWYGRSERLRGLLLGLGGVGLSLVACALVLRLEIVSIAVLGVVATLIAICRQPRVGLYALLCLVLLFENVSADPLMRPGHFLPLQLDRLFSAGGGGADSAGGGGGVLINVFEVLLFIILGVWLLQGLARRRLEFRRGSLWWPMMLFLLSMFVGLAHGAMGGDFHIGLWEARFLFYLVACYVLAANTIRTYRHLSTVTGLLLVANAAFAVEGAIRHLVFAKAMPDLTGDGVFEHVDVIFLGSLLVLTLLQNIFGAPRWQRIVGLIASPIAVYTLLASERRAGYIAVIIALVACIAVLALAHRKAFFIIAGVVLVGSAIYFPIFWNNTSLLGQPARAVRSISQPDERDAASNLYRDVEKINVQAGIAINPLIGIGFGQEFPFVAPLPDLSFWMFWHYEPHHNILWVWLKTGAIGFVLFWSLMGGAIARGTYLTVKLVHPQARVFALLTVACVVTTLVFCYVDLGLVSGRVTIFLGTLLGTLAVIEQLADESPRRTADARLHARVRADGSQGGALTAPARPAAAAWR